jgi:hypothetical protein
VANDLDQQLRARIGALAVIAGTPHISEPDKRHDAYEQAQVFRNTFHSEVILADREGQMLFNTRVPFGTALPPMPRPDGHTAAPQALASGQPTVGDTVFGPVAKARLIAVAVPVTQDGPPHLVVLTTIELSEFQSLLQGPALPPGWSVTVRDGKQDRGTFGDLGIRGDRRSFDGRCLVCGPLVGVAMDRFGERCT